MTANERPEAAPSDTDLQAAVDRLEAALDPDKRGGWTRLQDGDDGHSEIDDLRVVLAAARTSQPVQVEVTEFPFEHKGVTIEEDGGGLWITQGGSNPHQWISPRARAALSAALGGGE